MKILLLGNMGYVGSVVGPYLARRRSSDTMVGFDSSLFGSCLTLRGFLPEAFLHAQMYGDVRKIPQSALNGVDAIVYLAAVSNDPMGTCFEEATYQINRDAARDLAVMARSVGVRKFVFASSCSVYGAGGNEAKHENSGLNPLTAYAKSKVEAEALLKPLAGAEFKVVCLRFATACGFSARLRLDLVLNDFVASAVVARQIHILSDGSPWRPLIHVQDMARAVDWALDFESSSFITLNTGSNAWNYQVKDLAQAVAQELGDVQVVVNRHAAPDARSYQVDFGLFETLALHHQPQVDLTNAIRDLKEGLEELEFSDTAFRDSFLVRLNFLNFLKERQLVDHLLYRR